mmetsp:Transcript_46328/g.77020  ORF Transcript_46328/g.77020 Transcript_46328/m.77020 type:complete len:463 (-) Transcript_46328:90-1478(-)
MDESDGSEDYELLTAPSEPPEKPPHKVMFYVENNRHRGINDEDLRTEFNESLGKEERQKWRRRHTRAKKKYQKLLELYAAANPSFNIQEYNSRKDGASKSSGTRKSSSTGKRRRNDNDIYNTRSAYVGIEEFGAADYEDEQLRSPSNKRARRSEGSGGNSIDELFKNINAGTKRVIRDANKFTPSENDKIQMQNLVASMREAARRDWQCNRDKKPAINTSKLLDIVVQELSKKLFYKYYLDDTEILEALRDWIAPLPDGSLPAVKIRTELYRIIQKFALHEYEQSSLDHYLQDSEDKAKEALRGGRGDDDDDVEVHPGLKSFGKTVMNLWAHKDETNANKALLRRIIEKWIRTLTGSDASYAELREAMNENKQSIQQRFQILQRARHKRDLGLGERKRAQIPEKAWHDFAVAPVSTITAEEAQNVFGSRSNPMQDRMNKTFKRSTTTKQAARPSVTGRKVRN